MRRYACLFLLRKTQVSQENSIGPNVFGTAETELAIVRSFVSKSTIIFDGMDISQKKYINKWDTK